jgi:hypothetical protein
VSGERSVWVLTQGSYSDYGVIAVYETKADAEAVMASMLAARGRGGSWRDVDIEEFPYYPAGDTSLRPKSWWVHCVEVHPDGTITRASPGLGGGRPYPYETSELGDDIPDVVGVTVKRTFGHNPPVKIYGAFGVGRTKEQATKGAKDRAAEVAAMVLEGLDPIEVERARRSDK